MEGTQFAGLVEAQRTDWERGFIDSLTAEGLARYAVLEQRLLCHGGERLLCCLESDLERLIAAGCFEPGRRANLRRGRVSRCHENAARLFLTEGGAIGTGYAVSEDGIWRQHSWWFAPDGVIHETTVRRRGYFGIRLEADAAEEFAFAQL